MQIKLFSIPVYGGEVITEEMNTFLVFKKSVANGATFSKQ